jgi:hypothetical protein
LDATPVTPGPDNDEDGESRLKELREAATHSQYRKSIYIIALSVFLIIVN